METSLIVRLILITACIFSVVCQVISLLGHGWYGFTITMIINGTTIRQHVDGGLFYRSPYETCIDTGNGTVCKTPDQFPPAQRTILQAGSAAVDESFGLPKTLLITGVAASSAGVSLLYIYLCMSRKNDKLRCTGIVCAVFWAFAALLDIIAFGIQIARYKDDSNGMKHIGEMTKVIGMKTEGELMTPWAVIILGIASCWALIVGFVVALTTCGKRFDKTVIVYRALKDKDGGECLIQEQDDDDI